ncbi:DUF2185 domain-containing protein [Clostridium sp. MD294]|uniref:immunity protein Imm33 domain-containing protein n=1 Tax=Clostridium sp. MD294 TaxID=97138 RepID=UPI0002CA3156|nr:DUF2185 domain-containing protein [Clostridium sp. MD294]NDO45563.1 DUF2185 domain-containing protein [Clostridium sp. MD294]USF30783.1 hypothetical protein C820_002226 [Clostridium sp. MD294]
MKQSLLENLQKLYNEKKYQEIINELLEIEPEQWGYDLTCLFARALNEIGEYDDAMGYLLKVANQGRKDYMWYMRIGYTYFLQKKYRDATEMFEKALKLQPNNQEVLLFLAVTKSAEKQENVHDYINHMIEELKKMKQKTENIDMIQNIKQMIKKLPQHKDILNTHTLLRVLKDNSIVFHIEENMLKDWKGSRNCFATNRIIVEGEKIGFMYRDIPKKGREDSGWRFIAGDESSDYMADEKNFGLYDLNLLCNYDPDIIPFLNAEYGKAYYRDEQGIFREAESSEE